MKLPDVTEDQSLERTEEGVVVVKGDVVVGEGNVVVVEGLLNGTRDKSVERGEDHHFFVVEGNVVVVEGDVVVVEGDVVVVEGDVVVVEGNCPSFFLEMSNSDFTPSKVSLTREAKSVPGFIVVTKEEK